MGDVSRSMPVRAGGCEPSRLLRDVTSPCLLRCIATGWLGIVPLLLKSARDLRRITPCGLRRVDPCGLGRVGRRGRSGRRDTKLLEADQARGRECGPEASERRARLVHRDPSSIRLL